MAQRLESAQGQPVPLRELCHGLDVADVSGLLNYMRRVYAGRGRTLTRKRNAVVLA